MGFGTGKNAISRWRASEVEVLNQICREHGIEPLPPEQSRGSLSVKEYKEALREAEKLLAENEKLKQEAESIAAELAETRAMLEKANSKKVQLVELDSIEVKHTIFGNKVTMQKDDFDKIHDLAEKEIVSEKKTKKLLADNKKLTEENASLKKTVSQMSAELAELKKPKVGYISREALKSEARKITEQESTKSKLKKAMSFIQDCGLSDEFSRYSPNTRNRNYGLE